MPSPGSKEKAIDWNFAIERNHAALKRLVALLLVYLGLADDTGAAQRATDTSARALAAAGAPWTVSRRVRDLVLRLLWPVEAATRRLIVVLASQLPMPKMSASGAPAADRRDNDAPKADGAVPDPTASASSHLPLFALTDRNESFDWFYHPPQEGAEPWTGPGPERASPYEQVEASHLLRRVAVLAQALDDLPAQARRLARWRAARLQAQATGKFVALSPLRVGPPPGSLPHRAPKRRRREEHDILAGLHRLALDRWTLRPDTS